jgi:poly(3-hydroxybutyrate) depolymerase
MTGFSTAQAEEEHIIPSPDDACGVMHKGSAVFNDDSRAWGTRFRSFQSYKPCTSTGAEGMPVVFALHYTTGSGAKMANKSKYNALADKKGFMVIYPDAAGFFGMFNDGREDDATQPNDVEFLKQLKTLFLEEFNTPGNVRLNANRFYLTGAAAGAALVNSMACQSPDTFAAYAPVSSSLAERIAVQCQTSVNLMLTIGSDDEHNTLCASTELTEDQDFCDTTVNTDISGRSDQANKKLTFLQLREQWLDQMQCTNVLENANNKPDFTITTHDRKWWEWNFKATTVHHYKYSCESGAFELNLVVNGGHQWYGHVIGAGSGENTKAIDATEATWEFMSQF